MAKNYFWLCFYASVIIILDQVSKFFVIKYLPVHSYLSIVAGFLDLVHVRNRGAAFGFLNRSDIEWQFWLFFVATIIAVFFIFFLVKTNKGKDRYLIFSLALVLGGALGNFIDRIRLGSVVDFLDFYIGQWHWPAFNIADIAICLGAILTCFRIWQEERQIAKKTNC